MPKQPEMNTNFKKCSSLKMFARMCVYQEYTLYMIACKRAELGSWNLKEL